VLERSTDEAMAMDAMRRVGSSSLARALDAAERLMATRWARVMRLADSAPTERHHGS